MARRNGIPSGKAKKAKSKESKPFTNGDVVVALQTLPESQLFGVFNEGEEPEFLRQIYLPLRQLFSKTTRASQANYARIKQISRLRVPEILSSRFIGWLKDPLQFWERILEALPKYSDQPPKNRAKIFLEGVHALDSQLEIGRIFQRFAAVSASRLFKRANPTSAARIGTKHITGFLEHAGLENSEANIKKYGDILRRGQRIISFCQRLADKEQPNNNAHSDDNVMEQPHLETSDYGPLFFPDIPDSIWDSEGLHGKDGLLSIQYLRRFGIHEESERSNAKKVANVLLDFHANFVWTGKKSGHCIVGKRGQDLETSDVSATKRQRRQGSIVRSSNVCSINLSDSSLQENTEEATIGPEMLPAETLQSLAPSASGKVDRLPVWQAINTNECGTIWEIETVREFSEIISHNMSTNSTGEEGRLAPLPSGSVTFDESIPNVGLLPGEAAGNSAQRMASPPIMDKFGQGRGARLMQELSFEWLESLTDDSSGTASSLIGHELGSGLELVQELSFEWLDGLTGWEYPEVVL